MTPTQHHADVVVIGAGAGGLTAAAYLASLGRHVVVCDRQPHPGGNMSAFTRAGCEFDIGLHYVGGGPDVQPAIRAFLEPLGIHLRFREQDPDGLDTLLFGDWSFRVPKGADAYRARLKELFPAEARRIDRFLDRVLAIVEGLETPPPGHARDALAYAWHARGAIAASRTTLGRELDRLGCSPRLRLALSWLHATYAVAPERVALGMHAMVMRHYLRGAWYPEGGSDAVAGALVDVIEHHGGALRCDTCVTRILVEHGRVAGVRIGDDEELRAPTVVAAGDIRRTFLELLGPDDVPRQLRRRVRGWEMAAPLFVVYLVLDRDLRAEGFPNTNWTVADCDDIDALYACCAHGQLPAQHWTWITAASLKDPENGRLCRPGQTNLQLMSGAPSDHVFWGVGPGLARGEGYAQRRRELRDRLVADAERAIPGIADSIVLEETATPITLESRFGACGGTSYGIAAIRSQFGIARPGPRTPIEGLVLAGASTRTGHGITGAMAGGAEAAGAVTGVDIARTRDLLPA